MPRIDDLFRTLSSAGGSDLHLSSENLPLMRLNGRLQPVEGWKALSSDELLVMFDEIAPDDNKRQFTAENDTDFAYELTGIARYRCNLFVDRKGVGGVFRLIPSKILTAEQLGLSPQMLELCHLTKGMVLVTGPTGSGKSTTLCAMIDYINRVRSDHVITIEDPIEFVHENKKCLINQREVGTHTHGFKRALRAALREDPNIILVGEMRDLETIAIAIEMAETGHLVFGTLHTTTAAGTVDRIIDQFPADQQNQIRTMLAESLKGVIAQTLCRTKDGRGRRAALEVLLVTPAVASNIREGKTHQIPLAMQTGRKLGMIDLGSALLELVSTGVVASEEAYAKAVDKATIVREFERLKIPFQLPTAELESPKAAEKPVAPAAASGAQRAAAPPLPGKKPTTGVITPAARRPGVPAPPGSSAAPPRPVQPTEAPSPPATNPPSGVHKKGWFT
jgi:twitching motility protein PilT